MRSVPVSLSFAANTQSTNKPLLVTQRSQHRLMLASFLYLPLQKHRTSYSGCPVLISYENSNLQLIN